MRTMTTSTLTIFAIAEMDHGTFIDTLGDLFEHAPWVAEAAWAVRPFATEDALHRAMMEAVRAAPLPRQIAFLRGHPELAGKEAQAGTMTGHSTFEQRGLDSLSHAQVVELRELNAAYAQRHGFPFIIAVLGHTRAGIFDALRMRIHRDTDTEREEALRQIGLITRRRLAALFRAPESDRSPLGATT